MMTRMLPEGFIMYGQSALDSVLAKVSDELSKDPEVVAKYEKLVREKLDEAMPGLAEKSASRVVELTMQKTTEYNSEIRKYAEDRVAAYFRSPEGTALFDQKMDEAIRRVGEGGFLNEVLRHHVSREIGQLAQQAVAREAKKAEAKKARDAKKGK